MLSPNPARQSRRAPGDTQAGAPRGGGGSCRLRLRLPGWRVCTMTVPLCVCARTPVPCECPGVVCPHKCASVPGLAHWPAELLGCARHPEAISHSPFGPGALSVGPPFQVGVSALDAPRPSLCYTHAVWTQACLALSGYPPRPLGRCTHGAWPPLHIPAAWLPRPWPLRVCTTPGPTSEDSRRSCRKSPVHHLPTPTPVPGLLGLGWE